MAGAKMIRVKMTNGMTKHFRFNSLGKLTDGINLTDRINLTDDYKTYLCSRSFGFQLMQLRIPVYAT